PPDKFPGRCRPPRCAETRPRRAPTAPAARPAGRERDADVARRTASLAIFSGRPRPRTGAEGRRRGPAAARSAGGHKKKPAHARAGTESRLETESSPAEFHTHL